MAAIRAAANATATAPDEPVPEYNELLEEEVGEESIQVFRVWAV